MHAEALGLSCLDCRESRYDAGLSGTQNTEHQQIFVAIAFQHCEGIAASKMQAVENRQALGINVRHSFPRKDQRTAIVRIVCAMFIRYRVRQALCWRELTFAKTAMQAHEQQQCAVTEVFRARIHRAGRHHWIYPKARRRLRLVLFKIHLHQ